MKSLVKSRLTSPTIRRETSRHPPCLAQGRVSQLERSKGMLHLTGVLGYFQVAIFPCRYISILVLALHIGGEVQGAGYIVQ